MFKTLKQKLVLGVYVFLVLFIPIGSYLVSQQQTIKSQASEEISRKITGSLNPSKTTTSAQQEIRNLLASSSATSSPSSTPTPSPTTAVTFGPTLDFKLSLEGRPADNQASIVFVGISAGQTTGVQQAYLLSFTVDLPASGIYSGLSLAGLNTGSQYTAFIKPTAQIATSSAFIMSPSVTKLNAGSPINFLTGDLNEDNVINVADYNLAKSAYGSTSADSNWNEVADFNKDGVINNYDLSLITRNMGQTGTSGPWQSTPAKIGGESKDPNGSQGYWLWVPK